MEASIKTMMKAKRGGIIRKLKLLIIGLLAAALFSGIIFPYSIFSVYPTVAVETDEMRQQKYKEDLAVLQSLYEEKALQPDYVVSYSISLLALYEMSWLTDFNRPMKRAQWGQILTNVQSAKNALIHLGFQESMLSTEAKMYLEQMVDLLMHMEETVAYHINKQGTYSRKRINIAISNIQNDIAFSLGLYTRFWQEYYNDK